VSPRVLLLVALNIFVTSRLFTPLAPLLVYTLVGYVLAVVAALARPLTGTLGRLVALATLAAWGVAWVLVKPGTLPGEHLLDRFPSLGFKGFPAIVGSSYVFLKGWDAIRRAQRGAKVPSLPVYLAQMTFFPSFAAGPIAGPEPFEGGLAPTRAGLAEGANRILAGVAKAYVLALLLEPGSVLRLPRVVEATEGLSFWSVWAGVYASALWIYLQFAGYSDVAIGLGLALGVRLPENFDSPYLAPSPSEFWRRWHQSFTSWLREHVFSVVSRFFVERGLGGSALALVATTCAVMVVCGLWHLPSASFLVWGLYHGVVVSLHQLYATRLKPRLAATALGPLLASRAYRVVGTLATFHLVCLGWVIFLPVDASLADHLTVLGRLLP
jgi:D-alanyl-lipoteichoic acid acyltransferase DltB (MBOAT superfamily)